MRLAAGNTTESSTLFAVYVGLKCLQAISTALVFILYIYVVMTLWRKQVYHSNLIVLLMALPVSSLIAVVMTLAMDIVGAFDLSLSPLVNIIEFAVKSDYFICIRTFVLWPKQTKKNELHCLSFLERHSILQQLTHRNKFLL
ncbi:hypothetical protein GCK32_012751 [Trichostrongylus colubriformis]|uniref:Uncharacterized protein n=1 Tax=Trichostrongylus colubriformis TaxID=6319 RepID=A0AAN8IXB1_TRICO